ncbi:hypothetical protein CPB86DRAFT_781616 [Serendipita vermifera]|nr:hypothetical protein CPB86DRAFT_781616 [Serendipita vermifera]
MSKTRYLVGIYLKRLARLGAPSVTGPSRLPTELLITIVGLINGAKDLARLCRVSKLLRTIAEPRLYRRHFGRSRLAQSDIRVLLQHPRFEAIVNVLEIQFFPWRYCRKWYPKRACFMRNTPCHCDELDKSLGMALKDLLNLRVFRFSCSLCPPKAYERHRFFTTLQTRVLGKLHFSCDCSSWDETRVVESFRAPCMTSVVILGWDTRTPTSGGLLEFELAENKILPNLRSIHYQWGNPTLLFLQYAPITRLHARVFDKRILEYQGDQQTQIRAKNGPKPHGPSLRATPEAISLFQNLRHIGRFVLTSSTISGLCDELHTKLELFKPLKRLVSITVHNCNISLLLGDEYLPKFRRTLVSLSVVFPNLRTVLFRHSWNEVDIWGLSIKWQCRVQDTKVTDVDLFLDLLGRK